MSSDVVASSSSVAVQWGEELLERDKVGAQQVLGNANLN